MSPNPEKFGRATRRASRPGRILAVVGTTVALLALAACGGSSTGSQASADGTTTITVGLTPTIASDSVYVAEKLGYFKDNNLDVKIQTISGGASAVPALVSNSIQVGEANVFSQVQAAISGLQTPCFSGANALPTSTTAPYYVSLIGGTGVSSPADLVGKNVAVNSVEGENALLVKAFLAANGVDYNQVHFIALDFPEMPSALSSGRVSAVMASEPFTSEILAAGGKMLDPAPITHLDGQPTFACWVASQKWLDANKTAASAFASAMEKADAYITAHPDYFRQVIAEHNQLPAALLPKIGWPPFTSKLTSDDITALEKAGQQYGMLDSAPDPSKVLVQLGS